MVAEICHHTYTCTMVWVTIYCGIILPMFMDCQNFASLWGHYFMGNWFMALKCRTMHHFIKCSWRVKFRVKGHPQNPWTWIPQEQWWFHSNDAALANFDISFSTVACSLTCYILYKSIIDGLCNWNAITEWKLTLIVILQMSDKCLLWNWSHSCLSYWQFKWID